MKVRTILNPAPAPAAKLPAGLLSKVDILTPNETEFAAIAGTPLCGAKGEAAATRLARALGEALIVTLGAKGVRVYPRRGEPFGVGAFRVKAVDTVAAGDAFNGALALALAEDEPLAVAVRFASATAAISVTRRGAQPSLPLRREVDAFLKKHGGRRP
jgi:ribokinase